MAGSTVVKLHAVQISAASRAARARGVPWVGGETIGAEEVATYAHKPTAHAIATHSAAKVCGPVTPDLYLSRPRLELVLLKSSHLPRMVRGWAICRARRVPGLRGSCWGVGRARSAAHLLNAMH